MTNAILYVLSGTIKKKFYFFSDLKNVYATIH